MSFQAEPGTIRWKMHFRSSPKQVFAALTTAEGRAKFWAEFAPEVNGLITFHILNYAPFTGRVWESVPDRSFALEYFGTKVRFTLEDDGHGGTDLTLHATEVNENDRMEMVAGWVSVLMAMKAAVDYGVDLRNHDASRAWESGYADN